MLDVSASMRIGKRMDEAKKQAQELLGKYRPQLDRAALVTFDHDTNLVVPMTGDLAQISGAIDGAEVRLRRHQSGRGDAGAPTRRCRPTTSRTRSREIAVFSDLQRNGWATYHGDWKLAAGVTLLPTKLLSLKTAENVAITQVAIPKSTVVSARNEAISLQLVNYGSQDRPGLKVALNVDGAKVDEKEVNLGPNKTEVVRFNYKFEKAGDCAGTITVDAKDDFAEDNSYYFNVRVLPQVLVLLVNGSPSKVAAQDDGRFVAEALSVAGSPFQVKEISAR